jgi:Icc-related predicted phosphoesterase
MRFIEEKQPWVSMHGHIHESSRLTGQWRQQFGKTHSFNAAWDGPGLALVEFDLDEPSNAQRRII